MRALKRRAKSLAGRALFAARLERALLRQRGAVVAFHRVNDATAGDAISCGVAQFEALCRFFRRHFDVVPLREIVERLEGGRSVGGKLAITFDDGYLDNFEQAAPVLRALGLPATFFVVSRFIGTGTVAWWDAGIEPAPRWMSWDQVRALQAQGFEIGAHTRSHANLGEIGGDAAEAEIAGARADLEVRLGRPVDLFAYPYGRRDALAEANRALVRAAGFRCCASCHGGTLTGSDDPFRMPRIPINGWFADPHQFGFETALGRA